MKKWVKSCLIGILVLSLVAGVVLLVSKTDLFGKKEAKCTVTFETNGGSDIYPQVVENGKTVSNPGCPSRTGYYFGGWYTDRECTKLFDFSKGVTASCSVYAGWVDALDQTDTDGDGLTDPLEDYFRTKKKKVDSDNDGLSDYLEIMVLNLDPLKKDSNENGIHDGKEDLDQDGLTNTQEVEMETNLVLADTDQDGLSDGEEWYSYGTLALQSDTDEDGADDGWEVANGFSPTTYNTRFDIVVEAVTHTNNPQVTARVQINTYGEQASNLYVKEIAPGDHLLISEAIPGYLGSAYEFTTIGEIDSAVITFAYDTALGQLSEGFQPRIYYLNETTGLLEELPDQIVGDGEVSAEVFHFSTYILLNKVPFDEVWETEIKPPLANGESSQDITLDVMFVIDYSASMDDNDPYQLFKGLSEEFINNLRDGKDKAGAVKFIRKATLVSELSTDKDSVIQAINGITYDSGYNTYSGTDGSTGIYMALDALEKSESAYQFLVFITDGADNGFAYSYDYLIQRANENGVTIYAIGMGSASESVLRRIASQTGGNYYHAIAGVDLDDVMDLDEVFEDIEASTIDLTKDFNDDGIGDYYNELIYQGILRLSNGSNQFKWIDFNYDKNGNKTDDYDGDGIPNGKELKVIRYENVVYMIMESDPTLADTDGDRLLDGEDPDPNTWDVSDRDLAMLAQIVYQDIPAGTWLTKLDTEYPDMENAIEEKFTHAADVSEMKNWQVVSTYYGIGMQAAAYKNGNKIVVAYRGSESNDFIDVVSDWVLADAVGFFTGLNVQVPEAKAFMKWVMQSYWGYEIYVTGHSLGGNLTYNAGAHALMINSNMVKKINVYNGLGLLHGATLGLSDWVDGAFLKYHSAVVTAYRVKADVVSTLPYTKHYGAWRVAEKCSTLSGVFSPHDLHSFLDQLLTLDNPNGDMNQKENAAPAPDDQREAVNGKDFRGEDFVIEDSCVWYNTEYYTYITTWQEPLNFSTKSTIDTKAVSDGTKAISHILLLDPEDALTFANIYHERISRKAWAAIYDYVIGVYRDIEYDGLVQQWDLVMDEATKIFLDTLEDNMDLYEGQVSDFAYAYVRNAVVAALDLEDFVNIFGQIVDFEKFIAEIGSILIHGEMWYEVIVQNAEQGFGTTILFFYDRYRKDFYCQVHGFGDGGDGWIPNSAVFTFRSPYKNTALYGGDRFEGYLRYDAASIQQCMQMLQSDQYEILPYVGHYNRVE